MVQRDPVQGVILTFVKRWLIFNKCLALPGTYLAEKLEFRDAS